LKQVIHNDTKKLIDCCNKTGYKICLFNKCPYDDKECRIYSEKYGDVPKFEDEWNPERYTDEEIGVDKMSEEHEFCDCDTCAYCNININEEPCSNCSPSNCKYEPIEKEGRAKRSDTE